MKERGTCANQNKEIKCPRDAVKGHCYCKTCRLQTGGFDRYNPPAPSKVQRKQQHAK